MPELYDRALRFRNYAEELRIIAGDDTTSENRQMLLKLINSYEQLARQLEAVSNAKKKQGLLP